MQQRISIAKFPEFSLAQKAKEELQIKNPDITYQIRSHKNGFNLVRRHSVNEIQSFEDHYTKRRSGAGKRKKRSSIDGAFLSEVRGTNKN